MIGATRIVVSADGRYQPNPNGDDFRPVLQQSAVHPAQSRATHQHEGK